MSIKFVYSTEFSFIGTEERAVSGIEIDGRKVPFTGAAVQVEKFGITAEELAVFADGAESIHFERELRCIPVCGTRINDRTLTEQFAVLTVIAVADGEVVKTTRICRIVSRW